MRIFTFSLSFILSVLLLQSCGIESTPIDGDEPPSILIFGGSGVDIGNSIIQTLDDGYILTGFSLSNDGDFSGMKNSEQDIFVMNLSQNREVQWNKTFDVGQRGNTGYSITQITDGGYVLTGSTESNEDNGDIFVMKLSSNGDIQWNKTFGGSDQEWGQSIIQTTDGGYVLTGWTGSNDGEFEVKQDGHGDIFVIKLTSNGDIQWVKTFGGCSDGQGFSITQTNDGGYILTGFTESFCENGRIDSNITVIKLHSNGETQWDITFGGSSEDIGRSIIQTNDGGYVLSGQTESNDGDFSGMSNGQSDIFVIKLSSNGDTQWIKTFGGINGDTPSSIIQTIDSGYVLTGGTQSNDGDFNGLLEGRYAIFVMKLTQNGDIQWNKTFGGSGYEWGNSITQTSDGGFVLTGNTNTNDGDFSGMNKGEDDIFVIFLDNKGNLK